MTKPDDGRDEPGSMSIASRVKSLNIRLHPGRLYYAPEWLVLGVNNACNLHCKMCDVGVKYTASNFYQNLMGSHPLNMPLELISRIIDQAALYYPVVKLGYAFTEPLLYPHLAKSLAYAAARHLHTSVTTNALILKAKARELAEAGLQDIFISLDGPEEVHDQIRGHPGSFRRAVEGMEALLALEQHPQVSIFCAITGWNIGHLKTFADGFANFPLKRLGFMHTNFTNPETASRHNALYGALYPATISNTQYVNLARLNLAALAREIREIKSADYPFPVTFSPDLVEEAELDSFYHHPETLIGKRCNDAFRNIMIKSDGSVIPAHGRCYNANLGNLYEHTLAEIWNSRTASQFRKDLMRAGGLFPACARCCSAF